jgi:outer membrane murein-binding lipoprotein Lpp
MLKKILFSLFIVALSLSLVACGKKVKKDEYDAVVAQLEAKETELASKVSELNAKKAELDAKVAELNQKTEEVDELEADIADLEAQITALRAEISTLKGERTYAHDGVYTAFSYSLNYGAPQIVSVSVIIENDQIAGFFIDTLQSTAVQKDDDGKATKFEFNAKTKKQLGYEYYMFPASGAKVDGVLDVEAYKAWLAENGKKEWFEQANVLEQYMLENGVEAVELDGEKTTNVTGVTVTVKDYVDLAKEAVQNAKDGKLVAVTGHGSDIVWATAKVDRYGKVTDYVIDQLQGKVVDGAYVFNEKSKQQLGYDYYMFPASGKKVDGVLDVEGYKEWLAENGKKEWFEQVAILCDEFEANGIYNMALDASGKYITVSGVTIVDNKYIQVLSQVKANVK